VGGAHNVTPPFRRAATDQTEKDNLMTESSTMETAPERSAAAAAFRAEARPGDKLEAMLVEQMAAVHDAAMRCLSRAAEVAAEHPEIEARYLREATRLLNLFQRQSDALDRRRITAEDRADARDRTARVEEHMWRQEKEHAERWDKRPPPRPKRRGAAWPAWPAPADAGEDGAGTAEGRAAEGRAAKVRTANDRAAERRRLN
jgi:hypothetical protein